MTLPSLAVLLLATGANPQAPSPDPKSLAVPLFDGFRSAVLVGRLGSDLFADRDAASRELERMGRLALPALTRAAAGSPDPEVRLRSELLLPRAAALDFEARLACFLADTDGKFDHDLPGWARFRELTGNDPHARPLYADLLRSEPNRHLLAAFAQPKGVLAQRVIDRRLDLYARAYPRAIAGVAPERYEPTVEDAATLLFCETVLGDTAGQVVGVRAMTPYMLLIRPRVRAAVLADPYAPALKHLMFAWLDSRETVTGLTQAMNLTAQLKLKEGVKYAARLAQTDGATALQRATAATTIAKVGGKDDAKHLVPLFDDEALVRNLGNGANPIQLRDVALAMAAHLTGRSPEEFGMRAQGAGESYRYYYWNYSFASDTDRKKGFARWAELEPKLVKK